MTTIILLVVMFVGALLLVHVTLVQMLYMDTVRLRARELPVSGDVSKRLG